MRTDGRLNRTSTCESGEAEDLGGGRLKDRLGVSIASCSTCDYRVTIAIEKVGMQRGGLRLDVVMAFKIDMIELTAFG
jgi:transcription elongation factor Elf1